MHRRSSNRSQPTGIAGRSRSRPDHHGRSSTIARRKRVGPGSLDGANAGGHDTIALRVTPTGKVSWTSQLGTSADDRAADVAVQADGTADVAVFTNGAFAAPAGDVDIALLRLSDKGKLLTQTQFGTARADGGDPFAEENLYFGSGSGLWLTGLTYGSLPGRPNQGAGDVFVTQLDPATGSPSP